MTRHETHDPLTAALAELPEPEVPASIEANVMARIARLPIADAAPTVRVRRGREFAAWTWAALGLTAAVSLGVLQTVNPALLMTLPRGLVGSALVSSLALYTLGLFRQARG